jgi:hypothetical protein
MLIENIFYMNVRHLNKIKYSSFMGADIMTETTKLLGQHIKDNTIILTGQ